MIPIKKPAQWLAMVLAAGLVIGLTFCSSQQSVSSGDTETLAPEDYARMWIDQEPVTIAIPENIGEEAQLTRNFYFIMDGSGSMRERTTQDCGGTKKFPDKISGARWAIKIFLDFVPRDVNIGLFIFDRDGRREVVPLGQGNRQQFLNAVENIDAGGGTPLARAIRFGTDRLVNQYRKQLGYGEFRIVVVTDGIADGIPDAALYAAKYGIPIYAIGLCVKPGHPLRHYSVSYRAADNFSDLSQSLQDTLAELPSFDVTEFDTGDQ